MAGETRAKPATGAAAAAATEPAVSGLATLTSPAGTIPSTTGSSSWACEAAESATTVMADAPASTTRSAQVETPAPEIAVSPTRTVTPPRATTRADPPVGVAHDERERRGGGEAAAVSRSNTCGIGSSSTRCGHRATSSGAVVAGASSTTPPRTAASHP